MGVIAAFGAQADFSRLSDSPLFVTDVMQSVSSWSLPVLQSASMHMSVNRQLLYELLLAAGQLLLVTVHPTHGAPCWEGAAFGRCARVLVG
jgi:hypothetical protein